MRAAAGIPRAAGRALDELEERRAVDREDDAVVPPTEPALADRAPRDTQRGGEIARGGLNVLHHEAQVVVGSHQA